MPAPLTWAMGKTPAHVWVDHRKGRAAADSTTLRPNAAPKNKK